MYEEKMFVETLCKHASKYKNFIRPISTEQRNDFYCSNALKIIFNQCSPHPSSTMVEFMKNIPEYHYWSLSNDCEMSSSNKFVVHFRSPKYLEEFLVNSIHLGRDTVKIERVRYLLEEEYSGVKMNIPRILRIIPNKHMPISAWMLNNYFDGVNFKIGGANEYKTFLYFKNNEDMLKAMFQGGKKTPNGDALFTSRAFCKIQDERGLFVPNMFYIKNRVLQTEFINKFIKFYPFTDNFFSEKTLVAIPDMNSYINLHRICANCEILTNNISPYIINNKRSVWQTNGKIIIIKNIPETMDIDDSKRFLEISNDCGVIPLRHEGDKALLISGSDSQIFNLWLKNGLAIGKKKIKICHHYVLNSLSISNEIIVSGLPKNLDEHEFIQTIFPELGLRKVDNVGMNDQSYFIYYLKRIFFSLSIPSVKIVDGNLVTISQKVQNTKSIYHIPYIIDVHSSLLLHPRIHLLLKFLSPITVYNFQNKPDTSIKGRVLLCVNPKHQNFNLSKNGSICCGHLINIYPCNAILVKNNQFILKRNELIFTSYNPLFGKKLIYAIKKYLWSHSYYNITTKKGSQLKAYVKSFDNMKIVINLAKSFAIDFKIYPEFVYSRFQGTISHQYVLIKNVSSSLSIKDLMHISNFKNVEIIKRIRCSEFTFTYRARITPDPLHPIFFLNGLVQNGFRIYVVNETYLNQQTGTFF